MVPSTQQSLRRYQCATRFREPPRMFPVVVQGPQRTFRFGKRLRLETIATSTLYDPSLITRLALWAWAFRSTKQLVVLRSHLPRRRSNSQGEAGDCSAGGMSTHTSINYNSFDEPDIPKAADLRSRAESPSSGQTASIHTGISAIFVVIASDERVAVDNDRSPGGAGSLDASRNRSPRRLPPRQQPSERKP